MIYVLLPVYNEGRSIYDLLAGFAALFGALGDDHKLIIVNDGSSDDSDSHIKAGLAEFPLLGAVYVNHEVNRGLARALATGFSHVPTLELADVVITMDGDNTHDPAMLPRMLAAVRDGQAEIVIASRYQKGSVVQGLGPLRRVLSRGAGLLYRLRWRIPGVRDYTTGYRAYRGDLINRYIATYGDQIIEETGFAVLPEILKKLSTFRPRVVEVPLEFDYRRKLQKSTNPLLRTIFETLKMLIRSS